MRFFCITGRADINALRRRAAAGSAAPPLSAGDFGGAPAAAAPRAAAALTADPFARLLALTPPPGGKVFRLAGFLDVSSRNSSRLTS